MYFSFSNIPYLVRQEYLETELAKTMEKASNKLEVMEDEVKKTRSRKYKLESQLESQIASYDKEMFALQVR